jgi:hypothetical protein
MTSLWDRTEQLEEEVNQRASYRASGEINPPHEVGGILTFIPIRLSRWILGTLLIITRIHSACRVFNECRLTVDPFQM